MAVAVAPALLVAAAFARFDHAHLVGIVIPLIVVPVVVVTAEASFNPPRAAYLLTPALVGLSVGSAR